MRFQFVSTQHNSTVHLEIEWSGLILFLNHCKIINIYIYIYQEAILFYNQVRKRLSQKISPNFNDLTNDIDFVMQRIKDWVVGGGD
jgi:hypothetical protein